MILWFHICNKFTFFLNMSNIRKFFTHINFFESSVDVSVFIILHDIHAFCQRTIYESKLFLHFSSYWWYKIIFLHLVNIGWWLLSSCRYRFRFYNIQTCISHRLTCIVLNICVSLKVLLLLILQDMDHQDNTSDIVLLIWCIFFQNLLKQRVISLGFTLKCRTSLLFILDVFVHIEQQTQSRTHKKEILW